MKSTPPTRLSVGDDLLKYLRMTEDAAEIARFETFLRLVSEAERAGCTRSEAVRGIYPDVYGSAPLRASRSTRSPRPKR